MWAFLGAIAGGIISSVSTKRAQKREMAYHDKVRREQDAREDTKIQRMAKDADAAGLNPVTALRSGAFGMVGYQAPVFSSFSNSGGLGDAVARAFSALDDIPTQQQKLRETMEMDLLGAQIKNINQQTRYYSGLGRTPQANVTGFMHDGGGELSSSGVKYMTRGTWVTVKDAARLAAGLAIAPEMERGRATNPTPQLFNLQRPPWHGGGADAWQTEFGELGEWHHSLNAYPDWTMWNLVGRPMETHVRPWLKGLGSNPRGTVKLYPSKGVGK